MPNSTSIFRRHIFLPQDHGSWVFILCPLSIGLFTARQFSAASMALVVTAMAAFLIRQPVTIAIKAYSGRRPRTDLPAARFWMIIYGTVLILSVAELITLGDIYILLLGIPAAPIFAWHLWLISRREERRQAGIEILATGVLALAAPAAFWIGRNGYQPLGWVLWILTWFQSGASITYAYLRLEQREWKSNPDHSTRFKAAKWAVTYSFFNLIFTLTLCVMQVIPVLIWLPFLIQALETIWGTFNPAIGAKPVQVGTRQLFITLIFTFLFIILWR